MIKTLFICDECGKEQNDDKQMRAVEILVNSNSILRLKKKLWCRACMAKYSLTDFTAKEKHPEKVEPAPTFGEQIEIIMRDIAREEINQ